MAVVIAVVVVVGDVGDYACVIFAVVFGACLIFAVPVGISIIVDWIIRIE